MLQTFVRQIFPRPPAVSPMHSSYIKTIFTGFRSMSASSDVKVPNKLELNAECEKSIKQLKQLFKCSDETAKTLFPQIETSNLMALRSKFTFLAQNGATLPALMEHCSLLNMPTANLLQKFKLLKLLSWKATDDFLPFLRVSKSKLTPSKIRDLSERVYYLSEQLKIDPPVVSKYMSKHSFMWEMRFHVIKAKLKLLKDHGQYLSPINILRDLDIFQRKEESILERLNQVESSTAVKKAMPWMVKCPEATLKRSLELHMERGELINYLAKRLDWSRQTTNQIQKSFRRLKNYNGRCRNAEDVLSLLLPRFRTQAVTNHINVVLMPQKLIIRRMSEMHVAGVRLTEETLSLLYMQRSQFVNFIRLNQSKSVQEHELINEPGQSVKN